MRTLVVSRFALWSTAFRRRSTAIALDRGLVMPGGDGVTIVYDTPAGTIRARAHKAVTPGRTVSFVNVPSFVLFGGLPVRLENRQVRADHEAIVPEIEGAAYVTGEHTFFVYDDDPQREGFLL